MNKRPLRFYEFGPFRLNVTERFLQRSDEVVPLTPKVFDTLLLLVENSGHVLGKNELMQALWPDSFVEESSLTQNISLLRRALGEPGHERHYIETIPKRGYRFVAGVREFDDTHVEMVVQERTSTEIIIEEERLIPDSKKPVPKTSQTSFQQIGRHTGNQIAFAACACFIVLVVAGVFTYRRYKTQTSFVTPGQQSIAVLPFQTIGAQSQTEKELMGLGMADAIIIKLSALHQTKVLPTSSVSSYADRKKDASLIGRELGVSAVLDGTLQRDGDRVRITAQMIRSSDGTTLWSGKYSQIYSSIFALQDAIAEEVGSALMPGFRNDTRAQWARHETENREAYEAYVMGLYFWNKRTKENLPKVIEYLEQAVQKDSKFARAHALLADAYFLALTVRGYEGLSPSESHAKAVASVQRSLQLDDTIAEAHTVMGSLAAGEQRHELAEREFRRALELNPNYAVGHLRYGYFLFGNSRIDQALSEMKLAVELDPVSPISHLALSFLLFMSRDFDAAIRESKKAVELQPDSITARLDLIGNYIQKGTIPEALAECEEIQSLDPLAANLERAHAYGISGRRDLAVRMLAEVKRAHDHSRVRPYDYAVVYAALGDRDTAFDYLQKESPLRFLLAKLRFDPQLDPLRGDKRFDDLLKRPPLVRSEQQNKS
jgi:DNA-binding winged helix-turn-helix (wHTH) protein/TolB-like protein/Tfp pilus assembly protein PilF